MATGRLPDPNSAPVTAKGDLYTYSTVPAKLAVGSNGETLVADSSASTGLRWQGDYAAGKNKVINGDFRINQRGFTTSTTSAAYGFDRWKFFFSGGTVTYSAQTFTPGTAPVSGYEGINFARVQTASQSASSDYAQLVQKIEDVRTFANQTATISFWAKAASGTPKIGLSIGQDFGSGGSPSTSVITNGQNVTISTSWARYSLTVSVPSISGKTIGTTANTSALDIILNVSLGANYPSFGDIGIQNNTFDIWGVQAEAGSVATPFTTATGTLAGELAACQRYYLKSYAQATAPGTASNTVGNTGYSAISTTATSNRWNVRFPVNMRGTPTITIYSTSTGTSAKIFNEQSASDVDGLTQYIGESGFHLYANSGTIAAGQQLLAHYVASAEL